MKRFILLLVLAGALFGGITIVAVTVHDRRQTLEATSEELQQLVMLMAEQLRSTVDTDRVVLSRMEEMLGGRDIGDLAGSLPDRQRLRQLMRDDRAIQSLLIIGPDGRLVLSSHDSAPDDGGARGDRDYFRQVMPPTPRQDFISPLIRGRITGRFLFAISRRVEDADGRFLGVVQSSIDIDYFMRLYRRLARTPTQTFGIYKPDGTIVLRYPLPPEEGGKPPAVPHFVAEMARAPAGTYIAPSVFDGITRLFAYYRIPDLDLVVTSGIPLEWVLEGWRNRSLRNAGMAAVSLLVLLALARSAWAAACSAEAACRRATEANRSKSIFFASASHDLRQPLQAMRLFWTVAQGRAEESADRRLQEAVGRLGSAMQAGEELLNALLDVAVLEAGSITPRRRAFSLATLVAEEAAVLGKIAESRHLRLRIRPGGARVYSDPVLLRRILRNLALNALKFTERGGVLIGCRRRGPVVLLQVWDSGRGIAESDLAAIFEDLYQVDNPARDRGEGLGLGLSVVSRTARLLGHPVRVRSQLGGGSVFEVEVPLAG